MFSSGRSGHSSSLGDGSLLKSNVMSGQPTKTKRWTDYQGLAIPPCNPYYKREGSKHLVLPWIYLYTIKKEDGKRMLSYRKKVAGDLSLHDEIKAFVKFMKPTEKEIAVRQDLVKRFTQLILSFGVDVSAPEPVGSYVTGLYLPTSDIDMVLTPRLYTSPSDVLRRIYHKLLLMPSPQFHKQLRDVLQASVPLITITDAKTGIAIDLSAEVAHSRAATKAVGEWLKRGERLEDEAIIRMLVMVTKTFLSIRRCGTTYTGGINSYVLFWMVVAWVKLELPKMRNEVKTTRDSGVESLGTMLSDMRLDQESRSTPDYGKILIAFFKFYGQDFDYRTKRIIIAPEPRYEYHYSSEQPYLLSIMDAANGAIDMGTKAYAIKHVAASFEEAYRELQLLERQRLNGISVGDKGILGKVLGGDFLQFWIDRLKLDIPA
ncbi:hypothetical protein CVT24_013378 [Panaeolus cyanescens]|uniref:Poly(A) RNA polymerase mitochondrial-like central palm domain-containing protein n=1 Tax=Panaeolus cyanescens TaxID=181874 RepID=A0A409YMQ9_9AGAR|nr:hypothetical protein CVT24_013378 [Panaeolus cyanescens]